MGQLAFLLPDDLGRTARRCLDRACVTGGYDLAPMPTRRRLEGNRFNLTRDVSESGYLTAPWPVVNVGCPVVMSSTLRERPEAYHLLLELTRGKLNQVRCQLSDWELVGFEPHAADKATLNALVKRFGGAVLEPTAEGVPVLLGEVLTGAHCVGDRLTHQFAEQLMQSRIADDGKPDTRYGARVTGPLSDEEKAAYAASFNAVRIVPNWSRIEPSEAKCDWDEVDALVDWALDAGLHVSIGPLVDLTAGPFPEWLTQWEGDLPSLAAFMCDFVETIVTRYKDRINVWQVFAGFNHADVFGLYEDDRLRLAARLLESTRLADPDGSASIGLSVPWGDYLTSEDMTYSPLVFADTLMRGGYTLSGIELEMLCGEGPRASQPRTLLDSYRLLDLFALLGIPLELAIGTALGKPAVDLADPPPGTCPPNWATDTAFFGLSVSQVSSIYWDAWSAAGASRLPGSALWANGAAVGDTLEKLATLGREWLRAT